MLKWALGPFRTGDLNFSKITVIQFPIVSWSHALHTSFHFYLHQERDKIAIIHIPEDEEG